MILLFEGTLLFARSEILPAVVMKSYAFWDVTPCSPLKANLGSGGTCRLHLQGQRSHLLHAGFLLGLFFGREAGDDMFL
jgi:hypothetical protein